ncbi:DoxX family membrane protein [Oerskovia flava]|uniref:DoxX family membrane protein n=1 Tax=Oerskovia flava TaxID=2986422 RepID=UPI00223F6F09|nr:DoxX family membrane protein [Oerskovia sp. JB1-3-2]
MLLRHVARPMLACWFIYDGAQAALRPAEHVRAAREGIELVTDTGDLGERVGLDTRLSDRQVSSLVRVHGVATVVAGLFLATGKAPRVAALTLAGLAVPLAVANQPFTGGEATRAERTAKFAKNLGAIGAALIAGADYEGRPGVQWRVAKARHDLARAKDARQDAVVAATKSAAHDVSRSARKAARTTTKKTRKAVHDAAASVRSTV